LFEQGLLDPDSFDALVLVTQTPDHILPPTSNIIQGRLRLKQDLLCIDINQGCSGYLIGLMQAFALLDQPAIRRVALVVGDVLSRRVCVKDKNSYPLIGDAAAITLVENADDQPPIHANLKMDGTRYDVLMVPAGGFRMPSTPQTSVLEDVGEHNYRSKNDLWMNGVEVFNFVQREVPAMIDDLLAFAGVAGQGVDYYLFHQPNRFMLHKLADKMKVPYDKMPCNVVETFGNANSVTIPTNITFNLGSALLDTTFTVCLAGFGVGLTWSSMLLRLGPLQFCRMIDHNQPRNQ
jgi:3-oxoacyl-[acyl-carrier-protein] synthase III